MTFEKIVLLAKPSGVTSFFAMKPVKEAFREETLCEEGGKRASCKKASPLKVGHTGTLDSFADGLLVVLTGKLTRLAPFIEALPKEYRAEISFGAQTDTLDPTGAVVKEAGLLTAGGLLSVLPNFTGKIMQTPPEYSALKQGGRRLSDLARSGQEVTPKAREVTVFQIGVESLASPDGEEASIEEFPANGLVGKAVIRVRCSKGTYIRALARDIAKAAGSAAYLSFLRRLSVGSFLLEDAAGFDALKPFAASCGKDEAEKDEPPLPSIEEIRSKALCFTREIADFCGFNVLALKRSSLDAFRFGKAISPQWFEVAPKETSRPHLAVFCGDLFAGVIHAEGDALAYDFVV